MKDKIMLRVISKYKGDLVIDRFGDKVINPRVKLWYMDELGLTKRTDYLDGENHITFMESLNELQLTLCGQTLDSISDKLDKRIHDGMLEQIRAVRLEAELATMKVAVAKIVPTRVKAALDKFSNIVDKANTILVV